MPLTERFWAILPDCAEEIFSALGEHLKKHQSLPAHAFQDDPHFAAFFGQAKEQGKSYRVQDGVAIIDIKGPITRETLFSFWGQKAVTQGQDSISSALGQALSDPGIRAILLNINSPGGQVSGTKELADKIAEAARQKPMAAYANGLMASAAFWIGAATGRVIAPLTATVGSVGVLWVHADHSENNKKYGVSYTYLSGGKWKSAGNPDHPLSETDRDYFQGQINRIHDIFQADIARFLGISASSDFWAEGQTMLAEEAKSLGLVTTITRDFDSALKILSLEAKMDKATLAAQHPQLLEEIQNESKSEASRDFQAQIDAAKKEATASVLATLKAVAGEDIHAKVSGLVQAGVTAAQLEVLAPYLKQETQSPGCQSKEEQAKAAILAGLKATANKPVPGAAAQNEFAETAAAIERMSQM